jgi:hypothetical protein
VRRWIRRGALLLAGLVAGLVAAEVVARLAASTPGEDLLFDAPSAMPSGMYRNDPVLFLEPEPGFTGEAHAVGYDVTLRFNELGVRGGPLTGDRRWMAVGDSFTLSPQMDEEDTFVALLAEKAGVTVVNAGVDGYSTWQALERYRRLDDAVGSDTVILTFFLGNDLTDNEVYPGIVQTVKDRKGPPPVHEPTRLKISAVQRLLFDHSVLFAYIRVSQRREQMMAGKDPNAQRFGHELEIFSKRGQGKLAQLVDLAATPLAQLKEEAATRGDRLLVAVAPPVYALDAELAAGTLEVFGIQETEVAPDAPRQAVMARLQRLGIASCDLTPALAALGSRRAYLRFDGHWSAAGHEAVAGALDACLR